MEPRPLLEVRMAEDGNYWFWERRLPPVTVDGRELAEKARALLDALYANDRGGGEASTMVDVALAALYGEEKPWQILEKDDLRGPVYDALQALIETTGWGPPENG